MAYATRTLNVNTEIYNPEYCTKASGNCIILNYENGVYKTGEDLSGTILTNLGHSGLLRCTQAIVFQEEEENLLHHSSHSSTYVPMYLPTYQYLTSATAQQAMTMTDQVHSGPCMQAQLNHIHTNYLQHQYPATYGVSQQ